MTPCCRALGEGDAAANMALDTPARPAGRRFSNTRPHLLLERVKSGFIHRLK